MLEASAPRAGILRRLLSMLYESLIVFAILFFSAGAFVLVAGNADAAATRFALRAWLFGALGAYFLWCWTHGGQTLPMKAWKLRIVAAGGAPLGYRRALLRYALAWPSIGFAGAGLVWALFDRDRQFLHDRFAGTRVVAVPPLPPIAGTPA